MIIDAAQMPWFLRASPEEAKKYEEDTRNGDYDLTPVEKSWRDLHPTLRQQGYRLRPRYDEDWKPSWLGTDFKPCWCEDSIKAQWDNLMDATRDNGLRVAIKRVERKSNEVEIAKFLSSPTMRRQPLNHCVPILDIFSDPLEPEKTLIVMPLLRPFDDPQFAYIGEVVDFVGQTLDGLMFMHEQHVAHLCRHAFNIMMDATNLYPQDWHPLRRYLALDGFNSLPEPPSRIDHPVRYYFIDYRHSVRFSEGESSIIPTRGGPQERTVPEPSANAPHDAYKRDMSNLGYLYSFMLRERFTGLDFLDPLICAMTAKEPSRRLSAAEAVELFRCIRTQVDPARMRRRLRSKYYYETLPDRMILGAFEAVGGGIMRLIDPPPAGGPIRLV
ncbi:hypothetical protein PLICRDRAFT_378477 [Plicaturopsis crispa FD-325 SS-3]|nr:hypothetical protein PLICRDRAFT_378477 [Plicaturopsis crispa FD-325 SS-3]